MAGRITEESIRKVKESIELADLFADYTQVVRAGGMHKANCPIHKERTPSCVLYDDGHYHCFGCGAHGDVFSIVREMENCSFVEAVERLAQRGGIELEYEAGKVRAGTDGAMILSASWRGPRVGIVTSW